MGSDTRDYTERELVNMLVEGKVPSIGIIYVLKHKFGWEEKPQCGSENKYMAKDLAKP